MNQTRHGGISRNLPEIVILSLLIIVFAWSCLDALDRAIYPGCKVTGQSGNILTIEVDPQIDTGSDGGCLETAKLIQQICRDGWQVNYWGRIINLREADALVALGGAPARFTNAEWADFMEAIQ